MEEDIKGAEEGEMLQKMQLWQYSFQDRLFAGPKRGRPTPGFSIFIR